MRRVVLTDDYDGSESEDIRTVYFMINHQYREIDLSTSNLAKLQKAVKTFFDKSRETTANRARQNAPVEDKEATTDNALMRAWLRAHGYPDLGERGRIPEDALDAFNNAPSDEVAKWMTDYKAKQS